MRNRSLNPSRYFEKNIYPFSPDFSAISPNFLFTLYLFLPLLHFSRFLSYWRRLPLIKTVCPDRFIRDKENFVINCPVIAVNSWIVSVFLIEILNKLGKSFQKRPLHCKFIGLRVGQFTPTNGKFPSEDW